MTPNSVATESPLSRLMTGVSTPGPPRRIAVVEVSSQGHVTLDNVTNHNKCSFLCHTVRKWAREHDSHLWSPVIAAHPTVMARFQSMERGRTEGEHSSLSFMGMTCALPFCSHPFGQALIAWLPGRVGNAGFFRAAIFSNI